MNNAPSHSQQPGAPKRELVHICGDAPDPTGKTNLRGASTQYNLASGGRIGQPRVFYRAPDGAEFEMTVDVYQHPGQPLEVVMFCPRCSKPGAEHTLRISAERKHIEYDRTTGVLSIEPFQCTWELDSSKPVGLISSSNLCGWKVAIDRNVAKAA